MFIEFNNRLIACSYIEVIEKTTSCFSKMLDMDDNCVPEFVNMYTYKVLLLCKNNSYEEKFDSIEERNERYEYLKSKLKEV